MPKYRDRLPQLTSRVFLTDGGIETTIIFDDGIDLIDFAAFPLLSEEVGQEILQRYFDSYAEIAVRDGLGIVLETPTWRANPDWAARQRYGSTELVTINHKSVELLLDVRRRFETPEAPVVISGCIGPRGDGYKPDTLMSTAEAKAYHAAQIRTFAESEADLVTAITMTYVEEAIGIAEAAKSSGIPVVISFTVETDGRLPTGQDLGAAIVAVDEATGSYPTYYMVNCAHPSHLLLALDSNEPWHDRLRGLRANASKLSHDELDEAEELDRGNPRELAADYAYMYGKLPALTVLGGCCGTTHEHVSAISEMLHKLAGS
jgi:S-methylmethionine-dependent homocysteine/selenocysteine methylase